METIRTVLVCALYLEAKPFIQALELKPQNAPSGLQIFSGGETALVITGTGKVASAIATTFALTRFPNTELCCNVGLCGARSEKIGTIFCVAQITDAVSKRSWYPDLIQKSALLPKSLVTVDQPETNQKYNGLVDMEGSGFFEAASVFLPTHAIHLLKIVSDNADVSRISSQEGITLIKNSMEQILEYIASIFPEREGSSLGCKTEAVMTELLKQFHFTKTQQLQCEKSLHSVAVQQKNNRENDYQPLFALPDADAVLQSLQGTLQKLSFGKIA